MGETNYQFPRRNNIDRLTPAERAIYDATQAVEALPADVRLTEAVILLGQARDKVADYVDNPAGQASREQCEMPTAPAALVAAEQERGAVGISAERRKEITISTEAYYRALALERGDFATLKTAIDDLAKTHAALEDAERETATLTERLARARDAWDAWAEHHERCYACSTMRCEDAAEYRNRLDAALREAGGGE